MKKILLVNKYFEPGFRSGGPQRSLLNFVDAFHTECEISVLTHNFDFGDRNPYKNIIPDEWINKDKYRIYYSSRKSHSLKFLNRLITDFDIVYLCGLLYCVLQLLRHE